MSGKWNVVRRVIDRGRDWYEETFLDRGAGLIVHRQASPFRDNADFERFLEDLRKAGWKGRSESAECRSQVPYWPLRAAFGGSLRLTLSGVQATYTNRLLAAS